MSAILSDPPNGLSKRTTYRLRWIVGLLGIGLLILTAVAASSGNKLHKHRKNAAIDPPSSVQHVTDYD